MRDVERRKRRSRPPTPSLPRTPSGSDHFARERLSLGHRVHRSRNQVVQGVRRSRGIGQEQGSGYPSGIESRWSKESAESRESSRRLSSPGGPRSCPSGPWSPSGARSPRCPDVRVRQLRTARPPPVLAPRTLPVERMLADERSGGFLLLRKLQQCSCPKAYLIVKFHNSRVHCVSVVLGVCASSLQLQFKMESASHRKPSKHVVEIRELDPCQAPQLTGPPAESPHRIAVGCLQKSCRGDS